MALIGEVTGSGGLTVTGSLVVSGAIYLGQHTASTLTVADLGSGAGAAGGLIYVKGSKLYFVGQDADAETALGGLGTAQTWTATQTFSEVTGTSGFLVADDKKIYFGTGKDASFEYDEDGTDTLLYAGASMRISDDTKVEFGTGGDASIEYDENGTDELRFAGAAATFEQAISFDGNVTMGLDDTGVDVRIYSATTNEGVLYDASEDELGLLLTTKLKFHDIGGAEEIFASANGHLEVNAGTTLDITAPTVDINASTAVTLDSPSVVIASSTANKPRLELKNTTNDTNSAILRFVKDKGAAGAANDNVGIIEFYGDDANQDQVLFGRIRTRVAVHTDGQEGGKMQFAVASHDGELNAGLTISDGDAEDEIDVTIGNGSASRTTVSGDMTITTIANPGSDVDKFLVSNSGVVGYRTGAEVASDIGAVASDANITFSGKLTASNGMLIPDDVFLAFGTDENVTIEYDEDGNDTLIITGAPVIVAADLTASNGLSTTVVSASSNVLIGGALAVDGDADFDGRLIVSGAAIFGSVAAAGADTDKFLVLGIDATGLNTLQYRAGSDVASDIGAVASDANITFSGKLTASNGMLIPDDVFLTFGTDENVTIEYDEDGNDTLIITGAPVIVAADLTASNGLSTTTISASSNVDIGGTLSVDGVADFDARVNVSGAFEAASSAVFFGQLTASNGMSITGDVSASSDFMIGGGLHVDGDADFDGRLIVSGAAIFGTVAAAGADTDKFLVLGVDATGLNTLQYRAGSDVASDIGAVAADANITFSGKLTASNGFTVTGDALMLADGVVSYIGTGGDLAMFHNGTDSIIQNSTGDFKILSTVNSADAIFIEVDGGTSETITIHSDQGTSVTEGASSIQLLSDAGGVELKSTANLAKSIKLIADGGAAETIYIQADQGTTSGSIHLVSDAGGIKFEAAAVSHVHDFASTAPLSIASYDTDGDYGGTILKYSPGADDTLNVGQLYFLHTDGTWDQCDADAVATGGKQLLGVGLGGARSDGVLIKGFIRIPSTEILNVPGSNASPGLPVYISTTAGHFDFTAPSGDGDIVRIVGYAIQDSTDVLIYFDPDPTYVEVSA